MKSSQSFEFCEEIGTKRKNLKYEYLVINKDAERLKGEKSMSFKDELSASMKTPQQVEKEREDATIIEIRNQAEREISALKRVLKENASNGSYMDLGSYKVITGEVSTGLRKYCEINSRQGKERKGFFGNDIHIYYTVTCNYSSSKYAKIYLDEINRIAQEDGIECTMVAAFTEIAPFKNKEHRWNIPGTKRIDSFGVYPKDIKIHIQGSIKI